MRGTSNRLAGKAAALSVPVNLHPLALYLSSRARWAGERMGCTSVWYEEEEEDDDDDDDEEGGSTAPQPSHCAAQPTKAN